MFVFDIETLGIESNTVVLSAAIIHFDENSDFDYQDLLDNALFVKFNAKEQIKDYNRTVTQSTIEWWNGQDIRAKDMSFTFKKDDLSAVEGISRLKQYITAKDPKNKEYIFARGSLDQMAIDSLCRAVGVIPIKSFWMWRDIRTAIDFITDNSDNGYCEVSKPGFDRNMVIKHDPIHDCAYDIMMMKYPV